MNNILSRRFHRLCYEKHAKQFRRHMKTSFFLKFHKSTEPGRNTLPTSKHNRYSCGLMCAHADLHHAPTLKTCSVGCRSIVVVLYPMIIYGACIMAWVGQVVRVGTSTSSCSAKTTHHRKSIPSTYPLTRRRSGDGWPRSITSHPEARKATRLYCIAGCLSMIRTVTWIEVGEM